MAAQLASVGIVLAWAGLLVGLIVKGLDRDLPEKRRAHRLVLASTLLLGLCVPFLIH